MRTFSAITVLPTVSPKATQKLSMGLQGSATELKNQWINTISKKGNGRINSSRRGDLPVE